MIDSLIQLLDKSWLGTAIGVLSIIVAVVIYRASAIGARPVYYRRSFRVIGFNEDEFMQNVEILYRGKHVDRLTRTRVIFWNAGKKIIYGSDIVADDAVRCELSPDALALEVRVIKHTRDANKFTAIIDDNSQNRVILSFDYLDPQDGVVVELLHTDSVPDPVVKGTIRGVPKGLLDLGSNFDFADPLRRRATGPLKIFFIIVLIAGFICIIVGAGAFDGLLKLKLTDNPEPIWFPTRLFVLISGVVYVMLGAFVLFGIRRRYPRTLTLS
jgi:hypothetical protein